MPYIAIFQGFCLKHDAHHAQSPEHFRQIARILPSIFHTLSAITITNTPRSFYGGHLTIVPWNNGRVRCFACGWFNEKLW